MKKASKLFWVFAAVLLSVSLVGCPSPTGGDSTKTKTPTVIGITVMPATANVAQGGTQPFSATVSGTGAYPTTVTWSIDETDKNAGTSISALGELTVAAVETLSKTLTIRATTTLAGSTVSGTATVTVIAPPPPPPDPLDDWSASIGYNNTLTAGDITLAADTDGDSDVMKLTWNIANTGTPGVDAFGDVVLSASLPVGDYSEYDGITVDFKTSSGDFQLEVRLSNGTYDPFCQAHSDWVGTASSWTTYKFAFTDFTAANWGNPCLVTIQQWLADNSDTPIQLAINLGANPKATDENTWFSNIGLYKEDEDDEIIWFEK